MPGSTLSDFHVHHVVVNEQTMQLLLQHGAGAEPAQQATWLIAAAWHLRQRDTQRALELAEQAEQVAQKVRPPSACASDSTAQLDARLQLTLGEVAWLNGDLADAQARAEHVLSQTLAQPLAGDVTQRIASVLACDAHLLHAHVAMDRGDAVRAGDHAQRAGAFAALCADPARHAMVAIVQAQLHIEVDAARATPALDFPEMHVGLPGAIQAGELASALAASLCRGLLDVRQHRHADAIAHLTQAAGWADQLGQGRYGITACLHTGAAFQQLYDLPSALAWTRRAVALSRSAGWPRGAVQMPG